MTEGGICFKPGAARGSTAQPCHLGRHSSFVHWLAGYCAAISREAIKTSRCGSARILGILRCRHSYRAARTRLRRRSVAFRDFFICEAKAMDKMARQHGWCSSETVFLSQRFGQFWHCHVRFCLHAPSQPIGNSAQLTSLRASLRRGIHPTCLPFALHNPHRAGR